MDNVRNKYEGELARERREIGRTADSLDGHMNKSEH